MTYRERLELALAESLAALRQVIHEDMTHQQQRERAFELDRADRLLRELARNHCETAAAFTEVLGNYWRDAMKEEKR